MINQAIFLQIDRLASKPIYMQICDALREQIINGYLSLDQKLTSSRNLSVELRVSRTSVVSAYEQLQAEGYIESRHGAGCFVTSMGSLEVSKQFCVRPQKNQLKKQTLQWSEKNKYKEVGAVDMRLFPYRKWASCVARVARESPESLVSTIDSFGDRQLRASIANYLYEWRGIKVSPKQILVTAGSVDALEICIRLLLEKNQSIGLEDPGYLPLRNLVSNMGSSPVWLPIDKGGAQIPSKGKQNCSPKAVILTPSHQFPLGGAMSPERRMEFLNWADETNGWIIEDDYDSEFRYAGKPIPALTGYDQSGRTIYIGSFSKIYSTGLRLGYMVVPESLLADIHHTHNKFASKASVSMQRVLSEFMDSGEFYRHVRRLRRIYAERRRLLISCLITELADVVTFKDHQAGILFTIILPNHYDDIAIAEEAQKNHIYVVALSNYYANQQHHSGLLISFCMYENDEIINSIAKLKVILKRYKR